MKKHKIGEEIDLNDINAIKNEMYSNAWAIIPNDKDQLINYNRAK